MAYVIRKRNLWFLMLVLLLGIGVFLKLKDRNEMPIISLPDTSLNGNLEVTAPGNNVEQILKKSSDNFFVDYRIERERIRSLEIEILREEIINNPNSQKASRDVAQKKIIEIVELMEKELIVENMIKAKGFEEAVCFIQKDGVNVVVKTSNLDQVRAVQIGDIVNRTTGIKMEHITIIPKN